MFPAGTVAGSRQEYGTNSGRIKMKYEFSLEFKTSFEEGVMFYVGDDRHIDFIALYMKGGKVRDGSCIVALLAVSVNKATGLNVVHH
jgi:hypothetical protein